MVKNELKIFCILFLVFTLSISLVDARDWTPYGDINLQDYYSIKQGVNATFVWFNGLFNWTTVSNYLSFDGAELDFNETILNNTISDEGVRLGFNSTYNVTYDAKADYQFKDNNFNGSGNITVNQINSDINITNPPVECPAGSFITRFFGLTSTCTEIDNDSLNVNSSVYWNGNAWSDTRWLNNNGSNANQDINIGIYDFNATVGNFGDLKIIGTGARKLTIDSTDHVSAGVNLIRTGAGSRDWQIIDDGGFYHIKYSDDDGASWTSNFKMGKTITFLGTGTPSPTYTYHIQNPASGGVGRAMLVEDITTSTGGIASSYTLKTTSTGNMVNGFGAGMLYAIQDTAGVERFIARTAGTRNGADSTGKYQIDVANAGSLKTEMSFETNAIKIPKDNSKLYFGAGDDVFTQFTGTEWQFNLGNYISKWTSSTYPVLETERTTTITTGKRWAQRITLSTTADMTDGFGPSLVFGARDNYGSTNMLGQIAVVRDGADGYGKFEFIPNSAGTLVSLEIDHLGHLYIPNDNSKLYWGAGADASVTYDGTDMNINPARVGTGSLTIGDGGITDYTEIKDDGEILRHGTARVKKDLWIGANGIKAPGSKPATFVEDGLTGCWEFADAIEANQEQVSGTIKIPLDMDITVVPTFNIGWHANGANPGNCKWQFEYLWAAPNEDVTAAAQETLTVVSTGSATSNGLVVAEVTGIDLPSSTDKAMFWRVTRLSSDVQDTISAVTHMRGQFFQYTSNKFGSAT